MEDGTAHSGNSYIEVGFTPPAPPWWGYVYAWQEHPVTEGKTYQSSAWVRDGDADGAPSLIAGGATLTWEWRSEAPPGGPDGDRGPLLDVDGDGTGGNSDKIHHTFDLTEEWTYVSAVEVAPPGAKGLSVIFGTPSAFVNVDIDNASFVELGANAAVYLWNGIAADGLWETPANWTVTDSTWTWPNEENAADPNMAKFTNADTIAIDILNGDAVTHTGWLAIQGALDGSTTAVLTLNNASSLTLNGRLATSTTSGMMGRGQIDILGGSTVTIIGDGEDLRIADDNDNWGTMNIVDSTVDIADDLVTNFGEGHITISGSSVLNADDIVIADPNNSVGYMDISGTSLVTVVDDLRIDQGVGYITISGDAIVSVDDEIYVGDNVVGLGYLDISGNAIIIDVDDLRAGDDGEGHVTISGNASLSCDNVQVADKPTGLGTLDISGNAWVYVNDDLAAGEDGIGTASISGDATVFVRDLLYVAHDAGEGTLNISDNATVNILDDLNVGNAGGVTATLNISGNPTINVRDDLYMNDDSGDPANSKITMDGGTVYIGDQSTFNDDNNGTAEFIMNGGSFYSDDDIYLSDNLDGTASLTVNGGSMITGDNLKLGEDGGEDIGQARVFMNGGLFQAEGLSIAITDTQIVYSGGEFRIAEVNEAEMQQLITDGTIVPTGAYNIATDGNYTVLSSLSPTAAKFPSPADGASDVLLGSSLSWTPGDTAATHDVYFGTTNPPALAGNQAEASYYPGLLQPGTTYYWQIDEVEADDTTKHAGSVNSFTTGNSNVAMQIRIKASSDDTESDINGSNNLSSGDLEIPYDGDPKPEELQVIGLRFADVGLAKGTTITSAAVQFSEEDSDDPRHAGDVHLIIEGQLNPNSDTFADVNDPVLDRQPRTAAMVEWDPPSWCPVNAERPEARTSDVSSIIQELIDQDGWAKGNALVLTISDNPDNPSVGMREAWSFDGAGGNAEQRPTLHLTAIIDAATGPNPANGATDVPLDAILSWWPGIGAVSHNVYLDTSATTSLALPPTYLVDGDSQTLPWVVEYGTISFDGQTRDDGDDPDFISAGASGNTFDIPDLRNWAKLSFDFDVDSAEFIYGGNNGNITVEAKDNAGALIASLYQADTSDGQPAGPVTFYGLGIRSLHWKDTSSTKTFAALDNIILTTLPPALLGNTTQVSFDPGVLTPSTTYYWQVDAVDADGTIHTGEIWSFTTLPGEATEPDPADGALGVALDATLTWLPGATAVSRDVYFGTTSPPPLIGSQTDPNFDPGPLEMETTYYWQVDEIDADGTTVYTGDVWSFKTPRPGTGTILYEIWDGIGGGNEIPILTDNENYPYNPTSSTELSSFDAPVDRAEEFGGRIHGYLHPETSGDYTFWIASDDNGELWLSTDESPANAVLISTLSASAGHLNFDDGDLTPSGPIPLEGGQKYYIMALYKEGTGGDNCAVAWEGPDSPTRAVIVGYFLSPYVELKATSPDPADGATEVAKTVTLSWTPGGTAASHDVYLSADQQAVIDGTTLIGNQAETSFSPADLEKGITYYWRVDEIEADGTTKHTGDVWSFTVTTLGR